jgi:hypothetical protein
MTLLYDKSGKEHKIPHAIDAKEWLATGKYFLDNPKGKGKAKQDGGGSATTTVSLV